MYLKQYPTKALAPLMLEDYRKVMVDHRGEEEQYSYEDILRCMRKGKCSVFTFHISFTSLLRYCAGTQVCMYDSSHLVISLDISVIPLDLKQTIQVDKDLSIRAYYAGHVCAVYFSVPY